MIFRIFALLAMFAPLLAHATPAEDEKITREYQAALLGKDPVRLIPGLLGPARSRLALDAVENILATGKKLDLSSVIPFFAWPQLPPKEQVRWFRLGGISNENDLAGQLAGSSPDPGILYELLALPITTPALRAQLARMEDAFPSKTRAFLALKNSAYNPPSVSEVRALFSDLPDIAHFEGGAWSGKPRLFLFCRHDRNYPCLLAMKDKDDKPVRTANGTLWTQPGLGLSGYGKPFNERLGNTPSGVQLVNSVMPIADQYEDFGKFRRMVLEFPPASTGEAEMKRLLPAATHASSWWKEAAIARDMGRGELRIHGTGALNTRPDVLFYPFIATIGCVAQRELKYGGTDYVDQRLLLDQLMKAQGIEPRYANETQIRALLYVIDIDDKKAGVSAADLARFDIR
ncbi:MAG: hypothetical protein ACXVB9_01580 [Bdellovibrionota bacterium]